MIFVINNLAATKNGRTLTLNVVHVPGEVRGLNEKKNHSSWYRFRRGRCGVASADPNHTDWTATHQSIRRRRTKVGYSSNAHAGKARLLRLPQQ